MKHVKWDAEERGGFERNLRELLQKGIPLTTALKSAQQFFPPERQRAYFSKKEREVFRKLADDLNKVGITPLKPLPVVKTEVVPVPSHTIDIQIRNLVQHELKDFGAAITERLLGRIDTLLHAHELRITTALLEVEERLMGYWEPKATQEEERSPEKTTLSVVPRVLVAALYQSQWDSVLNKLAKDLEVCGRLDAPFNLDQVVDVRFLEQDEPLTGIKGEHYNCLFLMTRYTGHSMQGKLKSRFPKDKVFNCNGGPTSLAHAISSWLVNHFGTNP